MQAPVQRYKIAVSLTEPRSVMFWYSAQGETNLVGATNSDRQARPGRDKQNADGQRL